jgi:hypothetical protein
MLTTDDPEDEHGHTSHRSPTAAEDLAARIRA